MGLPAVPDPPRVRPGKCSPPRGFVDRSVARPRSFTVGPYLTGFWRLGLLEDKELLIFNFFSAYTCPSGQASKGTLALVLDGVRDVSSGLLAKCASSSTIGLCFQRNP
jgi:hypothetical protein